MSFYRVGRDHVMCVDVDIARPDVPAGFSEALQEALKKMLNKSLQFDAPRLTVKKELVDQAAVGMKTMGVAWTYRFETRGNSSQMLAFGKEAGQFDKLTVLPVALIVRDSAAGAATKMTDYLGK